MSGIRARIGATFGTSDLKQKWKTLHDFSTQLRTVSQQTYQVIDVPNKPGYEAVLMTQFVGALCYQPEVCGFGYRWNHWDFSLT